MRLTDGWNTENKSGRIEMGIDVIFSEFEYVNPKSEAVQQLTRLAPIRKNLLDF